MFKLLLDCALNKTPIFGCRENGIVHEESSPYNPPANGLAEAGVKIIKGILEKADATLKIKFKVKRNAQK